MFDSYDTAVAVIAIMIAASGIMLGFGYALDHRKLRELGKEELMQAAINGIIVGSLLFSFGPFGIMTSLINGITNNVGASGSCQSYVQQNGALCFAYDYVAGIGTVSIDGSSYPTLTTMALGTLTELSIINIGAGLLTSLDVNVVVASVGLSYAMAPFMSELKYLLEAVTFSFFSLQLQGILMDFIGAVAVPVLLPVGIVLRTFYFTRGLGGTIIALAIGLYAVFPMSYLLGAQLSNQYYQTAMTSLESYAGNVTAAEGSVGSLQTGNSILGVGYLITAVQHTSGLLTSGLTTLINGMVDFVAYLVVEVFFLPVFAIILTIVSTRELARLLGSEISFGRFDVF